MALLRPPASRQCCARIRSRGAFRPVRTLGLPCGASASLRPSWPAWTFAAPFYRCTVAPTRLGSTLLSQREDRAERARHDFCRWMSLRARLRITQTSRAQRRTAVLGRPLVGRPKVAFLPKRSPELFVARGRVNRCPTLPTAVARAEDFAPTPIASSTFCHERLFLDRWEQRSQEAGSSAL